MKQIPKHAELIKLWADGALIQWHNPETRPTGSEKVWADCHNNLPTWSPRMEYRVKPEPKPDVVMYCCVDKEYYSSGLPFASVSWVTNANTELTKTDNVMFVFDGETGKLKDVQLLAKE